MKKRVFLTTVFAASMLETANGCYLYVHPKKYGIDQLRGKEFISSLTNEPLVNSLKGMGINAELNSDVRISLQSGDTVYILNPNVKLHTIKDEKLPPYASLTLTKITVGEDAEIASTLTD